MKIRISITIDETEMIDLLTTERGELQAGNVGFSLAEAKSFLANGQKTVINAQAAMHAQSLKCAMCADPLRRNGRNTIVVRTLFGKVPIDSPPSSREKRSEMPVCASRAGESRDRHALLGDWHFSG